MEGAGLGVSPLSLVGWPYSRRVMFTIRMPFLIYFLCCFSLPFSFWCHSVRVGFGLSRCSFLFLVLPRVFWFCFLLFLLNRYLGLFSFAVLQHWFNSGERVKTQASFTSAGVPVSGSQAFPSFRRSRSLILFSEICSPGCSVKPVSGNLTIHWQHAGQHAGRWGTCVWQL